MGSEIERAKGLMEERRGADAERILRPLAEAGDPEAQELLGRVLSAETEVPKKTEEALVWFRRAAEQYLVLSYKCARGEGVPRDGPKAVQLAIKAGELGHPRGYGWLGAMYFGWIGIPGDAQKAAHYYRLAAEMGDVEAQYQMGVFFHSGYGVEKQNSEAFLWYGRAAEQGHRGAKVALASLCMHGEGVPRDLPQAARLLIDADEANVSLAELHLFGINVPRDWRKAYSLAHQWYLNTAFHDYHMSFAIPNLLKAERKMAPDDIINGFDQASRRFAAGFLPKASPIELFGKWKDDGESFFRYCYALSLICSGRGKLGLKEAMAELERAAQGHATAALILAHLLDDAHDEKKAIGWYETAANEGMAAAKARLGSALLAGRSVQRDSKRAAVMLTEAAMQGFPPAFIRVGEMHLSGEGIERDFHEAYRWFRHGESFGMAEAAEGRQKAAAMLAPAELEEAEREALATMPKKSVDVEGIQSPWASWNPPN